MVMPLQARLVSLTVSVPVLGQLSWAGFGVTSVAGAGVGTYDVTFQKPRSITDMIVACCGAADDSGANPVSGQCNWTPLAGSAGVRVVTADRLGAPAWPIGTGFNLTTEPLAGEASFLTTAP